MAGPSVRPHPGPGQHRTLYYGEYSSRVRGAGEPPGPAPEVAEEHEPRRRASPSWGRLIAKVYQVDPLVCTRCGKRMSVVAFVTDSVAIGKILDHLGLSNPEAEKPPPPVREMAVSAALVALAEQSSAAAADPTAYGLLAVVRPLAVACTCRRAPT